MAAPSLVGHAPLPAEHFDPKAARRLLAEAGCQKGFRLTLHTTAGRCPSDVKAA